jgi:hypothetical protein
MCWSQIEVLPDGRRHLAYNSRFPVPGVVRAGEARHDAHLVRIVRRVKAAWCCNMRAAWREVYLLVLLL